MNIFILILMMLAAGCGKHHNPVIGGEDPSPPEINKDTVFELVWETKIDSTRSIVGGIYNHIWKDKLILSGTIEDPPTIYAFNKRTGKKE